MAKAKGGKPAAVKKAAEQMKKVNRELKKVKKEKAKDNKVEKRLLRAKATIRKRLTMSQIEYAINREHLSEKARKRELHKWYIKAERHRLLKKNADIFSEPLFYRLGKGKNAPHVARRRRTLRFLKRKVLRKDASKIAWNRYRKVASLRGRVGRSIASLRRLRGVRRAAYAARKKKPSRKQMAARRAWASAVRSWKRENKGQKIPFHKKDAGHSQFVRLLGYAKPRSAANSPGLTASQKRARDAAMKILERAKAAVEKRMGK